MKSICRKSSLVEFFKLLGIFLTILFSVSILLAQEAGEQEEGEQQEPSAITPPSVTPPPFPTPGGGLGTTEEITLVVGDQKALKFPSISKVSIGDPNIANVKALPPNQVLVIGVSPGSTSLIIWDTAGEKTTILVRVLTRDPTAVKNEIQEFLGPIEGIKLKVVGEKVIIDGVVYKQTDFDRVNKVAEMFGTQVVNFVRLSPQVNKLMVEQINKALREAGIKGAVARADGASVFLEGSVASEKEGKKALDIATSIYKDINNLLNVGIAYDNLILIDAKVIEISTEAARQLGFTWGSGAIEAGQMEVTGQYSSVNELKGVYPQNTGIGGLGNVSETTNKYDTLATFNFQLLLPFVINTLIQDKIARILSNPKLVCKNGGEAEFLVGGEVAIVAFDTVQYKEYGIKLKIEPKTDQADNILTKLALEVSDIDYDASSLMGYPSFIRRSVETEMNLRRGQTVAISGLLSNTANKGVMKFPILGQIPILGELFKSRAFRDKQTEVMIMVTPELTHSADPKNAKTLTEWRDRYDQASSELRFSILD